MSKPHLQSVRDPIRVRVPEPSFANSTCTTTAAPAAASILPNSSAPSKVFRSPRSPSKRACTGSANTNTPVRPSSSRPDAPPSGSANASHLRTDEPKPASPKPTTQLRMDFYIESELQGAIFHDPKFTEHFLCGDEVKLNAVHEYCRQNDVHYKETGGWAIPEIKTESTLYKPVLDALNIIREGVHRVKSSHALNDDSSDHYVPPVHPLFKNCSSQPIPSDEAETEKLKPDIVLFEDGPEHWETVRIPIEIKKLRGYHKAGMKQLSRYARAMFAHQLHRRHLYGMMVCGSEATFVRFDRSGILYSPRIDVCENGEVFTRALASLLMTNRMEEGYDTIFTTRTNCDGRLEYFIDLPESAFDGEKSALAAQSNVAPSTREGTLTRRFKVMERLCHRKSISGRATIVLRIRQVFNSELETTRIVQTRSMTNAKRKRAEMEAPSPVEYVLKMIWRDPRRGSEGEVLNQLHGLFGLPQYVWHCDAPGDCSCSSPSPAKWGCDKCVEQTVKVKELQVCDKLNDISISVPLDDETDDPQLESVDTTEFRSTAYTRKHRVYSYILVSSIGAPIWTAQSPREFLTAVLDAILGYWQAFNLGILHRDISSGNVMLLDKDQRAPSRIWLKPHTVKPEDIDVTLKDSEALLREVVAKLDRDPTGILSDFDLHTIHSSVPPPEITMLSSNSPSDIPRPNISSANRRPQHPRLSYEDSVGSKPHSKRRKTNSRGSLVVPLTTTPTNANLNPSAAHESQNQDDNQRVIDFRTGTPAFMSVRVLTIQVGQPYQHSYLDDLESFFWLIIWSVAAHIDSTQHTPSPTAQEMLNGLDESNFGLMAGWKTLQLTHCAFVKGARMMKTLDKFTNSWASDPILRSAIINLGQLFCNTAVTEPDEPHSPLEIFPRVVTIIQDALSKAD